jgi:hypothetical protein
VSSAFLEIVEMPNGDIALQSSDEGSEPLVIIQFSRESRVYLMDSTLEVARAMIQAGIETAARLAEQGEGESDITVDGQPRIIH